MSSQPEPKDSIYEIPLKLLKRDIYKSVAVSLLVLVALIAYSFIN